MLHLKHSKRADKVPPFAEEGYEAHDEDGHDLQAA